MRVPRSLIAALLAVLPSEPVAAAVVETLPAPGRATFRDFVPSLPGLEALVQTSTDLNGTRMYQRVAAGGQVEWRELWRKPGWGVAQGFRQRDGNAGAWDGHYVVSNTLSSLDNLEPAIAGAPPTDPDLYFDLRNSAAVLPAGPVWSMPNAVGPLSTSQGPGQYLVLSSFDNPAPSGLGTSSSLAYLKLPLGSAPALGEQLPPSNVISAVNVRAIAVAPLQGAASPDHGVVFLARTTYGHAHELWFRTGTFGASNTWFIRPLTPRDPWDVQLATGDIDGDSDADAVAYMGSINNGAPDPFFARNGISVARAVGGSLPTPTPAGLFADRAAGMTLADIDGDSDLDLAAAGNDLDTLTFLPTRAYIVVRRNDGTGAFGTAERTLLVGPTGDPGETVLHFALADVDGDGDLDAALGWDGGETRIYPNRGNGTFDTLPPSFEIALGPAAANVLQLADLDGDGVSDLVVGRTDPDSALLTVRAGGDFTFEPPIARAVPGTVSALAVAPFDADATADAVVVRPGDAAVLFPGTGGPAGSPPFGPPQTLSLTSLGPDDLPAGLEVKDVDGDGDRDLLLGVNFYQGAGSYAGGFYYLRNVFADNPSDGFESGFSDASSPRIAGIAAGDLDGLDLIPDVALVSSGTIGAWTSDGFSPFNSYVIGTGFPADVVYDRPHAVISGRLAATGSGDQMLSIDPTGVVHLLQSSYGLPFYVANTYPVTGSPIAVAAGQLTPDTQPDFATLSDDGWVTIWRFTSPSDAGTRTDLRAADPLPAREWVDLAIGDVTGDGRAELVTLARDIVLPGTDRLSDGPQSRLLLLPVEDLVTLGAPDAPGSAAGGALDFAVSPNPLRAAATLRFALPRAGRVRLELFDVGGRRVATPVDAELAAGEHRVAWRAAGTLRAGVYLARLETPAGSANRRIVVLP